MLNNKILSYDKYSQLILSVNVIDLQTISKFLNKSSLYLFRESKLLRK